MLVLPNKSAFVWNKFLKENEVLVYKFIVKEIKKNLYNESKRIDLFKFEDETMIAWIPKDKIMDTLEQAMKIFVKSEEYEYARKTDNIIKQYYINKLINDTKLED